MVELIGSDKERSRIEPTIKDTILQLPEDDSIEEKTTHIKPLIPPAKKLLPNKEIGFRISSSLRRAGAQAVRLEIDRRNTSQEWEPVNLQWKIRRATVSDPLNHPRDPYLHAWFRINWQKIFMERGQGYQDTMDQRRTTIGRLNNQELFDFTRWAENTRPGSRHQTNYFQLRQWHIPVPPDEDRRRGFLEQDRRIREHLAVARAIYFQNQGVPRGNIMRAHLQEIQNEAIQAVREHYENVELLRNR
jgi:hypothetical protein